MTHPLYEEMKWSQAQNSNCGTLGNLRTVFNLNPLLTK